MQVREVAMKNSITGGGGGWASDMNKTSRAYVASGF